jgi:hypothetical protein
LLLPDSDATVLRAFLAQQGYPSKIPPRAMNFSMAFYAPGQQQRRPYGDFMD